MVRSIAGDKAQRLFLMAKLPPKLVQQIQRSRLRMDVEDLQGAYLSSLSGLVHREEEIAATVRAALGLREGDDWPDRNDDDPDDPVGALYDHAGDLDEQRRRGAPMIRKAFLIALFHAWERYLNDRLKREQYDHLLARKTLIRDGHAESWSLVRDLQLAANCAKHGPGTACADLYSKRPDFFPRAPTVEKASERTLVISPEALDTFFATILAVSR